MPRDFISDDRDEETTEETLDGIAIIGMAGRFPGADDIDTFWENITSGVESITRFSNETLEGSGIPPELIAHPQYVKARSVLENADQFDAAFFGISPREAEVMDPQHRVFLETSWEALENAGLDATRLPGTVGVYAGSSLNTYLLANICRDRKTIEELVGSYQVGNYQTLAGNDKDYLATRVSYKLNLKGPSLTIQSGCSTSLVAVCQACQSLLNYQCDIALAGGVSITFPQERGALYQEGGMISPDGHCRAFDAESAGTVFGAGAGVVVLKRLAEAVADGDTILAVIKGYALNNDGSEKASYTAPSSTGQAEVIRMAQELAGFDADTISYVETHGTGTPLGDPIEIAGLTEAFRASTDRVGFCAIGSVKPHIGHLEIAAGVTGLIKTTLALKKQVLPPTLHFTQPNPRIDFARSPFFVNRELTEWETGPTPRRAGVSSFGVGGTNAHVVLEEAPNTTSEESIRPFQLLLLSARTPAGVNTATHNLARHLRVPSEVSLADTAYTLAQGRRAFDERRAVVCRDTNEAALLLEGTEPKRIAAGNGGQEKSVAFLFPGQGSQQVGMGRELYANYAAYRDAFDACCTHLPIPISEKLRRFCGPTTNGDNPDAENELARTSLTQPALFVVEYALAQLYLSWGIRPQAMVGHSLGEYVAACLSGVFTLPDVLHVLAERARLIEKMPTGSMLAVRLPEAEVSPLLPSTLSLAAVNGAALCVVAGPTNEICAFQGSLDAQGTASRLLKTSHAFHSQMMDPVLERFADVVRHVPLNAPQLPFISNLSGTWASTEVTQPDYWVRHLREAVRFAEGASTLLSQDMAFVEVGPSSILSGLLRSHPDAKNALILSSLDNKNQQSENASLLHTVGQLWTNGITVDWDAFYSGERRLRVPLPTYPFERKRFWVEPARAAYDTPATAPVVISTVRPSEPVEEIKVTKTEMTTEPNSSDRHSRIVSRLMTILQDQSGIATEKMDVDATFLDMGFDSLFLTQVSQAFQKAFGVKVTFRNLMEDTPTLNSFAKALDQKLSPDALPAPAAAAPVVEVPATAPTTVPGPVSPAVAAPTTVPSSGLEALFTQQLQVMAQQIAVLQSGQSTLPTAAPIAVAAAPVVAPTSAPAPAQQTVAHPDAGKAFGPYKPLQTGPNGTLTPTQKQHLDALMARYISQTPGSRRFTAENRQHLSDPRAAASFRIEWKDMVYPIVAERAEGARLWDVDGNEFLDITMGFGVHFLGHSPAFVRDAVTAQLAHSFEIGPQTPLAGQTARLFCEMTGWERSAFCNTGSEAVMAALRLARTVTGRDKIVYFAGDYHGTFDEVLARPIGSGENRRSLPAAPGIPSCMTEQTWVLEYGTPDTLEFIRAHASEIAAVLVEPVQSRNPDFQPREFLHEIRRITKDSETALIFDEIVTGFRISPGGAQEFFGIKADMAAYGKIVGGGIPIGILAGDATYMDALDGGQWQYGDASFPEVGVTFFAGTFVRHPLALAAAWAVLNHIKERGADLQNAVNERTARLVNRINAAMDAAGVPVHLGRFGSLFYPKHAPDLKWASLLWYHLREKKIHVWEGRPCFLSTAHTDEDVEQIYHAFVESVAEMQQGGFLPGDSGVLAQYTERAPKYPLQVPLTDAQREVWLAAQMGSGANCALVESVSVHLNGVLNAAALETAVQKVAARHEALWTTFAPSGEFQTISAPQPFSVTLTNLAESSEPEVALAALLIVEGRTPLDLESGPVFRFRLVHVASERHVLTFSAHHVVCDGWSSGVILREIGQTYSALVAGNDPMLPAPKRLSEYTREQATSDTQTEIENAQAYWQSLLTPSPAPLELPTDRPRPEDATFGGSRVNRVFSSGLTKSLRELGTKQGCTLFTTLLGGFSALMARLSKQNDLVIGMPTAAQSQLENDCLVSHCVHLLPLRFQLSPVQTFQDYLKNVRGTVFDAYDHQQSTFGRILQNLPETREPGKAPLVSVTFNVDRLLTEVAFGALDFRVETNPRSFFQFDLAFNVVEEKETLNVECDFNTDLFDAETITRWLGHFETLLSGVVAHPEQTLEALPLLSITEQTALMAQGKNPLRHANDLCIHEVFEKQAQATPNAVALVYSEERITYRALNVRANRVAHHLRTLGVGPDMLVGLFVERSLEMVVGLLAILKAGGAYVPFDTNYPEERLLLLMEDTKPLVVLTQEHLAERFPRLRQSYLYLDSPQTSLTGKDTEQDLPNLVTPENLAYVLFTSGSTGKPNGVAVPHRAVTRLVRQSDYVTLDENQILLQLAPLSFDASTLEIWGALANGATLVLAPAGNLSLSDIGDTLKRNNVSTLWLTAGLFHAFVDHNLEALASLTQLLAGGDILSSSHVAKVLEAFPSLRLINGYGPTETTTFALCRTITPNDLNKPSIPIGSPIAGTDVFVLDEAQSLVPVGVEGELYIGGAGVAKGYLNQEELTKARFIASPFAASKRERLYRTGDRVKWGSDGLVEFLGRVDEQVKVRGFRIEPGEIEQALLQYPQIKQATVIARGFGDDSDKRLVAYVVSTIQNEDKQDDTEAERELRTYLSRRLPDHQVPSHLVFLPELPLTANGKVDRKNLPAPRRHSEAPPALRLTVETPSDAFENDLTHLWEELLNVRPIGRQENFFELGGHSLLAVRLFMRIEEQFGQRLPLPTLFKAPTIAQLACVLRQPADHTEETSCVVPIQSAGSEPPLFCIHHIHGVVLCYSELARYLAPNTPVYGVQYPALCGQDTPVSTVEEMARHYVGEIQKICPQGPYRICGLSFGGVVAFEVAHQLRAQNLPVDFVGLIDTYGLEYWRNGDADVIRQRPLLFRAQEKFDSLLQLSHTERTKFVKQSARKAFNRFLPTAKMETLSTVEGFLPEVLEAIQESNEKAQVAYFPRPYPGTVTLFRAKERLDRTSSDPQLWWGGLAETLNVREINGNHYTIVQEPFVSGLAQAIQESLLSNGQQSKEKEQEKAA